MNIGSLFLSLGIKGDTKSLDEAIKKVEELKKQTKELNSALKETKSAAKINIGGNVGGSRSAGNPELAALKEKANFASQNLKLARSEIGLEKLRRNEEDRERKKLEKEQKQREKERERATKDFFRQVENGFSFIAKAFTGGLLAGGIGGYVTSEAAKRVSLSNLNAQFGLDPQQSQRYAQALRVGSNGTVSNLQAQELLGQLSYRIASGELQGGTLAGMLGAVGLSPEEAQDAFGLIKGLRRTSGGSPFQKKTWTALLGELGISGEFAQALNADTFNNTKWNEAFNRDVLTNSEIDAARKVSIAASNLVDSFEKLQGKLLGDFAPAIEKIFNYIESKLNPENAKKAGEAAAVVGATWLGTKALKFAKNNPYATAALATYGTTEYLTGGNTFAGAKELLSNPLNSLREGVDVLTGKKKYGDLGNLPMGVYKRDQVRFRYKNSEEKDILERLGINGSEVDLTPERELSKDEFAELARSTAISNQTNNVNINTNINASSVDKTTIPSLVGGISDRVNNTLERNSAYYSKYPNMSYPK